MRNAIFYLSLLVYTSSGYCMNWVAPNDPWLRADLEYLSSLHLIHQPISTWPLPIKEINLSKDLLTQDSRLSIHQVETTDFKIKLSSLQDQPVLSHFGITERDQNNTSLSFSHLSGPLEANLSAQLINNQTDLRLKYDNTYLNLNFSDWTLGIGAIDRWWGPGWDSSLILSNNARPVPSFYFERNRTDAFSNSWLRWIGPWNLITFLGRLEENRAVPNALLWGMRIVFKPIISIEIGLSRTAIWAGNGRPRDVRAFTDILIGNDNVSRFNTNPDKELGNQLAGLDFKFSHHYHSIGFSIYSEIIGEDEAGGWPSRPLIMFGSAIYFSVYQQRQVIFFEYSDTALDGLSSEKIFGSAYRHGLYTTGYLHKGRTLGSTYDNDSQIFALGTLVGLNNNYKLRATLRHLNLNRDNLKGLNDNPNNSVSSEQLETIQLSFTLVKSWRSVSSNIFFLWNSNNSTVEDDHIESLAGISVSYRI